ncbi:hypothetical protein ACTA71_010927 [Dictyostelium dimigraforme]
MDMDLQPTIQNEIIKDYCIPKMILPKRVITDKFI